MTNENDFTDDDGFTDDFEPMVDFDKPEDGEFDEVQEGGLDDSQLPDAETEEQGLAVPIGDDDFSAEIETPIEYRKPTWDIYTLLLFLALAFIGLAGTALYFESAPPDYPAGSAPFKGVPR